MSRLKRRGFLQNALFGFAALALLGSASASAQPGGGGGGTGGGTIYYAPHTNEGADLWSMNSDGSNKTFLSSFVPDATPPSRNLHAGQRWLVEYRCVPGEWPHLPPDYCRMELFAVPMDRNEALAVQLTSDPSLEIRAPVRWMAGDSAISFVARKWENGQVVGGGVYVAALLYDDAGNISGSQPPTQPTISFNLVGGYYYGFVAGVQFPQPDLIDFDWSPDGSRLVYDRLSQGQLRIVTLAGQDTLLLSAAAGSPVWSPDNTKIAFLASNGIETINPNGSGRKTIIKRSVNVNLSLAYPVWSPTGSHLVYSRRDLWPQSEQNHLYRSTSTGTKTVNLTVGVQFWGDSYWWR